jgi:hypothetical protein
MQAGQPLFNNLHLSRLTGMFTQSPPSSDHPQKAWGHFKLG